MPPTRANSAWTVDPTTSRPRSSCASAGERSVSSRTSSPSTPGRSGPLCEEERHTVLVQAARGEKQSRGGLGVDPLQVVDEHQQGSGLGPGGQKRQRSRRDQEPVAGTASRTPAEGGVESLCLPDGDVVRVPTEGCQEFEEAGVRQRGLGLHPSGLEHDEILGTRRSRLQQRALADPRLTHDQQATGSASAGRLQHSVHALQRWAEADQASAPARQIEGFPRRDGTPAGPRLVRQTNRRRTP